MKKTLSLILALMLMLSFCTAAFAAEAPSAESQINTLFSSFASMKQPGPDIWSYAVTDLDHNGRLELLAACMKGADRRTSLLAWEVTPDGTAVAQIPTSGAYPDVIKGSADTYHNLADGTWAYQFDDVAPHAAADLAENKCTVQLKDGKLSFSAFANKLISAQAGQSPISYFNGAGQAITPEDYNAAAANAFASSAKSSTCFDWFLVTDAGSASRFSDSYAIFSGSVMPAWPEDAAAKAAAPAVAPTVTNPNAALLITKSPTSESQKPGATALFIANASSWFTVSWTFVAPNGGEYSSSSFAAQFPQASLSGDTGSYLSVRNVTPEMNGWGVYATFYGQNAQTSRTGTAYLFVSDRPAGTSVTTNRTAPGTVTAVDANKVTISLAEGGSVQVPLDTCSALCGGMTPGCSCTVWYNGKAVASGNVWHVDIYGSPVPVEVQPVQTPQPTQTHMHYEYYCPNCSRSVPANAEVCPYCGYRFTTTYTRYYCPSCMNQVSADADVCPYCGYIFATGLYNQDGTAFHQYGVQITEDPEHYYCPSCSHEVSADIDICPYCGYIFATGLYNQDGTAFHTYGTEITDGSEYESTGGVPDDAMGCPNCHGTISIYTTVCPWCGYNLNGGYTGYGDIPDYDDYFDYDYDDFLDYTDYVNPIDPYSGTVDDWAGWSDDWGDWDYEGIGSW